MINQTLRWSMFAFCCIVVGGLYGWEIFLLLTDEWMAAKMFPVIVLASLPNVLFGFYWLGLAKGWDRPE